jgi:replicative DNA helicase
MTAAPAIANIEAEAALLGGMMQEARLIDGVADRLSVGDFSEPLHGRIFSTIVAQHSMGKVANPVTLRPYFEADEEMKDLGGPGYLAQLTGSGSLVIGATTFAEQIRELAQRRRLVEGLASTIDAAGDMDISTDALAEAADNAISAARDDGDDRGEYSAADCLGMVVDSFDQPMTGVECGSIPAIDALLGPMRPKQLILGAGRPGMGKTASALSYALGAAARGHGVLFVSLEMSGEELAERMAADLCLEDEIPYEAIRDRRLSLQQRMAVCRARDRIAELPLQILDKQGLTIGRLRTITRRWARRFAARQQRLELVVVDYLQLLRTGDKRMDRFEAVTEISRSLKELAKEQGLAVFALSQLSREVEKRGDKRPMLSDLRESGQLEQDADAVLFFLRQEYYLRQAEPAPTDPEYPKWEQALRQCEGAVEFILAKRRNGRAGSRTGRFHAKFQAVR